jgi:hypothetical protein
MAAYDDVPHPEDGNGIFDGTGLTVPDDMPSSPPAG